MEAPHQPPCPTPPAPPGAPAASGSGPGPGQVQENGSRSPVHIGMAPSLLKQELKNVTKVLSKKDSVRDLKKDKDKEREAKPKKGKENKDVKKDSTAGLALGHGQGACTVSAKDKRDSCGAVSGDFNSTGSCSSSGTGTGTGVGADAQAGSGPGGKEVKFREPDAASNAEDTVGDTQPGSPKVPHKFISNWKHACDKTRGRTRDLLKRWRAPGAPDGAGVGAGGGGADPQQGDAGAGQPDGKAPGGWSEYVWATWVKRLPSEEEGYLDQPTVNHAASLTPVQRDKLSQFFSHLVDSDRDDVVSRQDFENLSERLRHFADWSDNSSEYHILREVEQNFVATFLDRPVQDELIPGLELQVAGERLCTLEQWLSGWGEILEQAKTFNELPVWVQYFPRVMFQVINKSGTGVVTRDELSAFYSSVLGLGAQKVGEVLDSAYKAMTANGDHPLCFPAYRWCFANFLLGRHRNGPGQYLFGPGERAELKDSPFPVDYSALNTAPEELEQYSPDRKSNRRSVVV